MVSVDRFKGSPTNLKTMSVPALKCFPAVLFSLYLSSLCLALPVHAQRPKIHMAMEALVAGKLPIISAGGTAFGIWGNAGFNLVTIVEGTEENALALRNRLGFQVDFTRYNVPGFGPFIVDRASVIVNPEVMVSTAKERLKWMTGIGVEWNGYFLAQLQQGNMPVDNELIERSRRKALPFISAGIQYDLRYDFCLQVFVRQMLLDAFRDNTALYFSGNSDKPDLKLNQQPTYFGFGLTYFFGANRDD